MSQKTGRLYGKSIIISGGTRGIGRALVSKFSKEGANVLFSFMTSEGAAEILVEETKKYPGRVLGMQADVRDRAHVRRFVQKAISEYGSIDVVINNAHKPYEAKWFEDTSWDEYQREVDTIIKGSFNMVQLALPTLKKNGGGSIINIGSTMAAEPLMQHSFYVTAKNALIGFSRSLALELGKFGVRVNVVTPGPLDTDHNSALPRELMERLSQETPLHNRMGTCEEVANAVFLLALPESDLVTGSNVQVSGGFSIS